MRRAMKAMDTNFTGDSMRAEFTESQGRRYLPEKSDHVQVLDTTLRVGIVLGPETDKFVQVMGAEDRPISRQVIEIVHDHSDEEIDNLNGTGNL